MKCFPTAEDNELTLAVWQTHTQTHTYRTTKHGDSIKCVNSSEAVFLIGVIIETTLWSLSLYHGGLWMLFFFAPVSCHTDTRGEGGVYTGRPHIPWPPPLWEDGGDLLSCPHSSFYTRTGPPTRKRRGADTVRCFLPPSRRAVSPHGASCLPFACAVCLRKKWCCHSPLRRGQRASLPSRTPSWFLSGWLSRRQCGCGARNATLFSRRQASEKKMKCFSRYLPYLFRPPSTILSSTCHTEGKGGTPVGACHGLRVAYFERVTWMFRLLLTHAGPTGLHVCRS